MCIEHFQKLDKRNRYTEMKKEEGCRWCHLGGLHNRDDDFLKINAPCKLHGNDLYHESKDNFENEIITNKCKEKI